MVEQARDAGATQASLGPKRCNKCRIYKPEVYVGKTLFGTGYTVRLEVEGVVFRSRIYYNETGAKDIAARIRRSINRSGTKKKSLTTSGGLY